MKVTTMACIQGAWLPHLTPKNILDIGAGTGLLSLMTAQRYNCTIDSVEIDRDAFSQLKENVAQSLWKSRITCHHEDIKKFAKHTSKRYDLIISNPPFYSKQLKSSNAKINHARHDTGLTNEELVDISDRLLNDSGNISILLPLAESAQLHKLCEQISLFVASQLLISDSKGKEPKAIVTILSKKSLKTIAKRLIIKNDEGQYSQDFISLLDSYYLYL